jgi:hypothetical protein
MSVTATSHASEELVGQFHWGPAMSAFIHVGLEQGPISFIYRPRPPCGQALKPTFSLRKRQPSEGIQGTALHGRNRHSYDGLALIPLREEPWRARMDRLLMRGPQPPSRIAISVSVQSPPMCK